MIIKKINNDTIMLGDMDFDVVHLFVLGNRGELEVFLKDVWGEFSISYYKYVDEGLKIWFYYQSYDMIECISKFTKEWIESREEH